MGDDELLGHDIWFVATGASDCDGAGMKAFLASHRDKLRGVFFINLESVGAGRLSVVTVEGEQQLLKGDRRIMNLVSKVCKSFHVDCGALEMPYAKTDAYAALARAEEIDYNKLYEADRLLHETWFAAMGKMYLWRTLQNAHADYSRFRMLDTMTTGGLAEVIADHRNLMNAIERCDLAAFEPLVERHLYGGIRRLGSKLTEEYADYFEPEK